MGPLHDATGRLIRTVDALDDADWSGPSLLPGWSRAHVVAHLLFNAEALTGVVTGVREGEDVPMYASQADRDADIETGAGWTPGVLRERLMAACQQVDTAVADLSEERYAVRVRRTPEAAQSFTAGRVGEMRLREVEIHHADLDAGYVCTDWPEQFCADLLDNRVKTYDGVGFVAHATDLDRRWVFGDGSGPVVSGPAGLLGWWATGRDPRGGLVSDGGVLPWMEAW